MKLAPIDMVIVGIFIAIVVLIGYLSSRKAGKDTAEFFLGGRGMPWWLLGISMVACTFSADTPNLVTGFVREDGVAKNWAWWAFLITGMVTVFIYARLWRRSNVMTDIEFYEIRYSGRAASFLRGFRAIYLGVLFNTLIMGSVTLAAIKIGEVMFGIDPWITVVSASVIVVLYSGLGGLVGVVWADFFQYSIAMAGAVLAAVVAVRQPEVQAIGGMSGLIDFMGSRADFLPDFSNPSVFIPLLVIPVAVQWWSVWYPGAEPGGGGFIAQKMLSARNEKNAIGATLLFNFAHYALRPWPWIIVAMASVVIYPDLDSIRLEFPYLSDTYLKDDIAYPVMLSKLSKGWLGLVVASLIAAYMSTIGTQLNWGSSYVVNDFYRRFIRPSAAEKELVLVGRVTTLLLMVIGGTFALTILNNATQAFDILLLSGAGSGAIFLLRWFWWRINAWTEIIAMLFGTVQAIILVFIIPDEAMATEVLDAFTVKLLVAVSATTVVWLVTMWLTGPEPKATLQRFYRITHPGGPGWKRVIEEAEAEGKHINRAEEGKRWEMPMQLLMVFLGLVVIYGSLFSIGSFVYGNPGNGIIAGVVAAGGTVMLFRLLARLRVDLAPSQED